MTSEDVLQELDRQPYVPLRLHLASGQRVDLPFANSAFVRQNTLLFMERLAPNSAAIGVYDVIALRLIERIELLDSSAGKRKARRRGGAA